MARGVCFTFDKQYDCWVSNVVLIDIGSAIVSKWPAKPYIIRGEIRWRKVGWAWMSLCGSLLFQINKIWQETITMFVYNKDLCNDLCWFGWFLIRTRDYSICSTISFPFFICDQISVVVVKLILKIMAPTQLFFWNKSLRSIIFNLLQ